MLKPIKRKPLGVVVSVSVLFACLPVIKTYAQSDDAGEVEYLPGISVSEQSDGEDPRGAAEGYTARRTASATKTDTPIAEITQSIAVVTREQMDAREVQSINQAVSYSAGVIPTPNTYYERAIVRGFTTWNVFRDGLDTGSSNTGVLRAEPYGLERVEVLRGPSSIMYGQVAPGGMINTISKKPTNDPLHELGLTVGSNDKRKIFGDFSDKLKADGSMRYRLTGLVQDGAMMMDYTRADRVFLAPSLEIELSSNTDLTILGNYQRDKWSINGVSPTYSPNLIANIGAMTGGLITELNEIPRRLNTFSPDTDVMDGDFLSIGYQLEHRARQGDLRLRQNVRAETSDFKYKGTEVFNLTVNGTEPPVLPVWQRNYYGRSDNASSLKADQNAEFLFGDNGIYHKVLAGFDFSFKRYNFKASSSDDESQSLFMPDAPVYTPAPALDVTSEHDNEKKQMGLYIQDQVKIRDRYILSGSLRHDWASRTRDTVIPSPESDTQKDTAVTGHLGAMILMEGGFSPYISYSTSFDPVMGIDEVKGGSLKPEEGRQYELGIKWQPQGRKTLFTISAFDILQQNVVGSTPEYLTTQIGEVGMKGLELEVSSTPVSGLNVSASYSYLDSRILKNSDPALQSNWKDNVPRHTASMFAEYELQSGVAQGLVFGAGLRYIGDTVFRDADLLEDGMYKDYSSQSYSIADLSLRYNLSQWDMSLVISNVFDKDNKITCDSRLCKRPEPREMLASVRYNW